MLLCLPLLSQQLQLSASPPLFFSCVWRLLPSSWFSSASSVLRSLNSVLYLIFFFFLVSFLWFWVSLSSFLLLSPLLEPYLLFFLLSVRSLLGAVAVTPPKKKKKMCTVNFATKLVHTKRALSSTVINSSSGAGFMPSLQPSWSPLIFPFFFTMEKLYGTRYQSGFFSIVNVGSSFHCLCSFFFFLFIVMTGAPKPTPTSPNNTSESLI